jgi:SAM-dependent methyltransferase
MTQNTQIIGLDEWLLTPPGRYLLAWEQHHLAGTVGDLFGFHAVQLGLPQLDVLAHNRMPHRWIALDRALPASLPAPAGGDSAEPLVPHPTPRALLTEFDALPFETQSMDLVVMPHTLELAGDPHRTLREVDRVLVPEGRIIITGLNPASLWGMHDRINSLSSLLGFGQAFLPRHGDLLGYRRVRDWLRLLSFEVESGRFGCYLPPLRSRAWLDRLRWMDGAGERWWPVFGAAYYVVAVKRVRGMRLIGPVRKPRQQAQAAPAVVARKKPWDHSNGGSPA